MDPEGDKNKVYFMWDFVGRTLVSFACLRLGVGEAGAQWNGGTDFTDSSLQGYIHHILSSLENLTEEEEETWVEAKGRAGFSKVLITDQMPGVLDQMIEQAYPGQNAGKSLEFGEEILEIARRLDEGVA